MTNSYSLITVSFSLMAAFLFLFIYNEEPSYFVFSFSIVVAVINFSFFLCYIRKFGLSFFSFSFIFLLGYLIVHFQVITLEVIGYELPNKTYSTFWASDSVKNKSILYSLVGLLSYFFGYYLSCKSSLNLKSKNLVGSNNTSFLLIGAYACYILFFINSGSYSSGDYSGEGASSISSYFFKFFNVLLSSIIIIKLSSFISDKNITSINVNIYKYLKYFGLPVLFLVFWHMIFSLYVGDRGQVIFYGVLLFSMYYIRFNKLELIKTIIYILILSISLTIIGQVRQSRHTGESLLTRFTTVTSTNEESKWYDQKVYGDSTLELALSMRTLNHSIYNVPSKFDYQYGLFQLQRLLAIVPGVSGVFNKIVYDGERKYDGTANFITFLIQGDNPLSGDGTSIIADIYLDYGLFGILFVMVLFGFFIGSNEYKLVTGTYTATNFCWVAMLIFLANSLYLSRSSIFAILGNIVFIFIFIHINKVFINAYKK